MVDREAYRVADRQSSDCFRARLWFLLAIMNAKIVLLVAVLAGGSQALAADERVTLAQTPPAVQAAIKAAQIPNPIKEITRRTRDGRTTYEVEFERNNAPNPHLRI